MKIPALDDLVGDPSDFIRTMWGKLPLLTRNSVPDPHSIISPAELDDALSMPPLGPPYLQLRLNGHIVHPRLFTYRQVVQKEWVDYAPDPARVAEYFRSGATVAWHDIDHFHSPTRDLCSRLEEQLGCVAHAVAFATPPGKQGLNIHYDAYEVFVIQVSGTKTWTVYPQLRPLPTENLGLNPKNLEEPVLVTDLNPGDCLYVPWGSPHCAKSNDSTSIHLSLSMRRPSYKELLLQALEVEQDPHITGDLPLLAPGFIDESEEFSAIKKHLSDNIRALNISQGAERYTSTNRNGIRSCTSLLRDQDRAAGDIGDDLIFYRTPIVASVLETQDGPDTVLLSVGQKKYRLPGEALPYISSVLKVKHFKTSDIPTGLKRRDRDKILRHLILLGILTTVAPNNLSSS